MDVTSKKGAPHHGHNPDDWPYQNRGLYSDNAGWSVLRDKQKRAAGKTRGTGV